MPRASASNEAYRLMVAGREDRRRQAAAIGSSKQSSPINRRWAISYYFLQYIHNTLLSNTHYNTLLPNTY
ncbi:hypothetical protein BLOT_015598 [Blomia tropicalis]|nr:hypothetical protein BLOT_015598 [Blomia tropicalis]